MALLAAGILAPHCARYGAQHSQIGLTLLGSIGQLSSDAWGLAGWTRRRKLSLNNVGRAENLLDFPVMVRLDTTRIDYAQTQNAGQDLRFVDPDGSLLNHEIEIWNQAGISWVWVRVPRVDALSASDYVYMYYGNASVADGQNAAGVWTSNYESVLHLNGSTADSTSAANHGVDAGTGAVAGQIGNGRDCTGGASAYITLPTTNMASAESEVSLSLWVNPDVNTATRTIYDEYITAGSFWQFSLRIDNFYTRDTSTGDTGARDNDLAHPAFSNSSWQLATLVYSVSGGIKRVYHNGVQVATTGVSVDQLTTTRSSARICFAIDGLNFDGQIDEFRFANTARSADWISAQFASMSDSFTLFLAEEIQN